MSDYIESLGVIGDHDRLLEATLNRDRTISLHVEDSTTGVDVEYSLDEIRTIVSTLGHLLYVADNYEDDEDDEA